MIAVGPDNVPRAYQLKAGKLDVKVWRQIKGEIDELVEAPIPDPVLRSDRPHMPYLVTNGTVADTVLLRIDSANKVWKKHNPNPLCVVQRSELVT